MPLTKKRNGYNNRLAERRHRKEAFMSNPMHSQFAIVIILLYPYITIYVAKLKGGQKDVFASSRKL